MDITGIIKIKNEAQQVSEKFKKREFVLTTDTSSQYPQQVSFQLTQDKCSLLDNYNVGDEIKVHFNLRGREWTDPQGKTKYFNSLEAWRIESVSKSTDAPPINNNKVNEPASADSTFVASSNQDDDLPF